MTSRDYENMRRCTHVDYGPGGLPVFHCQRWTKRTEVIDGARQPVCGVHLVREAIGDFGKVVDAVCGSSDGPISKVYRWFEDGCVQSP